MIQINLSFCAAFQTCLCELGLFQTSTIFFRKVLEFDVGIKNLIVLVNNDIKKIFGFFEHPSIQLDSIAEILTQIYIIDKNNSVKNN